MTSGQGKYHVEETTMWERLTLEGEMCWVTSVR